MSERKRPRAGPRGGGERGAIAREAAQLMYAEDVAQYYEAKRIAARRVLHGGRYRHRDLPSNGEIRKELLELASLAEGPERTRRLFAMRVEALVLMRDLVSSRSTRTLAGLYVPLSTTAVPVRIP